MVAVRSAEIPFIQWAGGFELPKVRKLRGGSRGLRNHIWFTLHGTAPLVPCFWCGKLLTFNEATTDHEPPLAEGGRRRQAVIACYGCNQARNKEQVKRVGKI